MVRQHHKNRPFSIVLVFFRGDQFRTAFAHLGDIRSVLALTATASAATFNAVCQRLSLVNPVLVGCPPNRVNIYSVKPLSNMDKFCDNVSGKMKVLGLQYPKTVIFYRRYYDCGTLYHMLRQKLGDYFTYPPGYPDFHQFRVIDMYTRAATVEMRENDLTTMCNQSSNLRIIIATSAFGMGIDCPDIREGIHWDPPRNIETYA